MLLKKEESISKFENQAAAAREELTMRNDRETGVKFSLKTERRGDVEDDDRLRKNRERW